MQEILRAIGGKYRSEEFNRLILPRSAAFVQAVGHRMAYEAAITAGVRPKVIQLYEASAIMLDIGWYVENKVFTRKEIWEIEETAVTNVYEVLDILLDETGVEPYVQAPIVSKEGWEKWVERMPLFRSVARDGKL